MNICISYNICIYMCVCACPFNQLLDFTICSNKIIMFVLSLYLMCVCLNCDDGFCFFVIVIVIGVVCVIITVLSSLLSLITIIIMFMVFIIGLNTVRIRLI